MRLIIELQGKDYPTEKSLIEANVNNDVWFVLANDPDLKLDAYLAYLYDDLGLSNRVLSKLRICRNLDWQQGQVSVIAGDEKPGKPQNMVELLGMLEPGRRSALVIENNDRPLLANILQQLIYLDYPVAQIDVKLRKEFKDAERMRMFMANIDNLAAAANAAVAGIKAIEIPANAEEREKLLDQKDSALKCYQDIERQIRKAQAVELKVAFAASKKTGKSVLVNCILRQELAPTSLEMATPNSCVYKLSPDDKFHLTWIEPDEQFRKRADYQARRDFATRDEIYKAINKEFRAAEKNADSKFAIPDMLIEYPRQALAELATELAEQPKEGNNYSSYTVYDTPGPDAAGTAHKESAEKAMQECDASVFAIDYSKYLTPSEEEYLGNVKEIFEQKGKFHTLLFTLNKMDLALQDTGAKSRVKSIDFIRNRLIDIDAKYGDCIIFATSAQDYFNTLVLEEAAVNEPKLQLLLDPEADWIGDFRTVKRSLKGDLDERATTALSNLGAEADRLEDLLEYDPINLEVMRQFSGMPQMMSYLKYVLESKAREEIVNSIAMTIGAQTMKLGAIIAQKSNLQVLLSANDEQIKKIQAILETYKTDIGKQLQAAISLSQERHLLKPNSFLQKIFDMAPKQDSLTLQEVLARSKNGPEERKALGNIYKDIWNLYEINQLERLKALKKAGKIIKKEELALPKDKVNEIISQAVNWLLRRSLEINSANCASLTDALAAILNKRLERIEEITRTCKDRLAKENVNLTLPELSNFDASFPELNFEPIVVELEEYSQRMQGQFQNLDLWNALRANFEEYGLNILNYKSQSDKTSLQNVPDSELAEKVKDMQGRFIDALEKAGLREKLEKIEQRIQEVSIKAQERNLKLFREQTEICTESISIFINQVDDRKKYIRESEKVQKLMQVLEKINDSSEAFMALWKSIEAASQPRLA